MCLFKRTAALALRIAVFALPAVGNDAVKEEKQKLEARYKHQKLRVIPPHVTVGLFKRTGIGPPDSDFNVHYDHFYPGIELPKKYQKRENFDERTTEEVTSQAQFIDQLQPGESLEVVEFRIFGRGNNGYVDLMLKTLSTRRLATEQSISPAGYGYTDKLPYEVHFRFVFPADAKYDEVVHEIDHYLVPASEYKEVVAQAQKMADGPRNIEIQPGMSKDDVTKGLGEPLKTITFGAKTILKYKDVTVELQDGRVTEVKAN